MVVILAAISLISNASVGQENKPIQAMQHQVRGGVGFSTSGILSDILNYFSVIEGVNLRKNPVVNGTYLYKAMRSVAVGGTVAYQHFSLTYTDPSSSNNQAYGLTANRFYIGGVGLLYLVQRPSISIYSGARIGFSNWNVESDVGFPSDVIDRVINFALGGAFAPQLIIAGGETYFTENFGLTGELAIGAPHLIGIGLTYRW